MESKDNDSQVESGDGLKQCEIDSPTSPSQENKKCFVDGQETSANLATDRGPLSPLEGSEDRSLRHSQDLTPNEPSIGEHSENDNATDDSAKEVQSTDSLSNKPLESVNKNDNNDNNLIKVDDNDGDPIPSGTGVVSKECSASELIEWSEILPKWHSKLKQRPRGLDTLVRNGVPEPLRGEVWQLLSGAYECSELMDQYRILLTKPGPAEEIILRDVHRTYPAHENFRSGAGSNSLVDSLFKVCKAYAAYDEEVGYCQGLSFLVAALLLHMPEEQAFCVFVRIMQNYGLRDLFRNNFDVLYLKFFQLERLLEDHMPDLYQHFKAINIEPFQYASQWFLTVFTAKFPLNAVFYIMDVFLLVGIETIFQIALALLSASKHELLALDFEGVLKFFRVQMPKRYRDQEHVQQLIALSSAISLKRLKSYAKSYEIMRRKEKTLENPTMKLENSKLTEAIVRLENENDGLARDLIASKIQLRSQLDILEDKTETLNRALTYSRQDCQNYLNTITDMEDERSRLEIEVSQLKEVCRRELQRSEFELSRNAKIIDDYKKICSQLGKRLDCNKRCLLQFIENSLDMLRDNESCPDRTCLELFRVKAEDFIERLKSDNIDDLDSSSSTCDSPAFDRQSLLQRKASSESDYSKRPVGAYLKSESHSTSSEVKIKQLTEHINQLEVELARTKFALVESECERQQLVHEKPAQCNEKSTTSGLSNKFDFVKSAISSATTPNRLKEVQMGDPRSSTSTLAKINNLISEKISNISQGQQQRTTISNSVSTPTFVDTSANRYGGKANKAASNNNRNLQSNYNSKLVAESSIAESENQC